MQRFEGRSLEEALNHAAETFGGVDAFVSERPYLTMAIATAVGVALGFVMGVGRPKVIVIRPVPPRT